MPPKVARSKSGQAPKPAPPTVKKTTHQARASAPGAQSEEVETSPRSTTSAASSTTSTTSRRQLGQTVLRRKSAFEAPTETFETSDNTGGNRRDADVDLDSADDGEEADRTMCGELSPPSPPTSSSPKPLPNLSPKNPAAHANPKIKTQTPAPNRPTSLPGSVGTGLGTDELYHTGNEDSGIRPNRYNMMLNNTAKNKPKRPRPAKLHIDTDNLPGRVSHARLYDLLKGNPHSKNIINIKRTKSGSGYVATFANEALAEQFRNTPFNSELDSVQIRSTNKPQRRTDIIILNVELDIEEEEIADWLRDKYNITIFSVYRLTRALNTTSEERQKLNKIKITINESDAHLFNTNIKIFYGSYRTQSAPPKPFIRQCKKCFQYGHTFTNCPVINQLCQHCGGNHDSAIQCQSHSRCINCGSNEHPATSRECPTYRRIFLQQRQELREQHRRKLLDEKFFNKTNKNQHKQDGRGFINPTNPLTSQPASGGNQEDRFSYARVLQLQHNHLHQAQLEAMRKERSAPTTAASNQRQMPPPEQPPLQQRPPRVKGRLEDRGPPKITQLNETPGTKVIQDMNNLGSRLRELKPQETNIEALLFSVENMIKVVLELISNIRLNYQIDSAEQINYNSYTMSDDYFPN